MSDYRKHPTRRLGPGQYDGVYGGMNFRITKVRQPKTPYENTRAYTHWVVYVSVENGAFEYNNKLYGAMTKEEAIHDALVYIDTYKRREREKVANAI